MPPRTPLLQPREYFERRGFKVRPAALAVGIATLSVSAVLFTFAYILRGRLLTTDHPDAADAVWGIVGGQLVLVIAALFLGWLLVGGLLHLLARATLSHQGSFDETLVIVGWGTAPTALTTIIAFLFLSNALFNASMTSPDAFVSSFQSNLAAFDGPRALLNFLLACWQTYLYGNGLSVAFDEESWTPYLVGGVVAIVGWLATLA